MSIDKFNKTIDGIQSSLVWFVVAVITICISVLFLFDVLAGTGTMLYLTGGKEWQSIVISLATTGLLFALMFIGYMLTESKSTVIKSVGRFVMVSAFLIYLEDVIFDALLADILRYGTIMTTVDNIQWLFRFLLGGISTVGDALAMAMILGMPVLKSIIKNAIPATEKYTTPPARQAQVTPTMSNIPRQSSPAPRAMPVSQPKPSYQAASMSPASQKPVARLTVPRADMDDDDEEDAPEFLKRRAS